MFCPECETEYREGFTTCSDCDVALVRELGAAALVPLMIERSSNLVDMVVEGLENAEVPYVIEAGTALHLLDGDAEEIDAPELWQARILVTKAKADVAAKILEEKRKILAQPRREPPLFAILWRFTTRTPEEFERHYGPDGTWVRFFRRDPEYVGSSLVKGEGHYLTLDWWTSAAAYEAFREENAAEYQEIDRMCEGVTASEEKLGEYESVTP